jgi:hypothetical protein
MQRAHTHSVEPISRSAKTTFVAVVGFLLMAAPGLAQDNPPRGNDSGAIPPPRLDAPSPGAQGRIPEAPVGHRQPRPQDLPPSVLRDEGGASGRGSNAEQKLEQELQICKGC